ncbi:MAG: ABC transporter permease [Lachnospiraceae bacterium]|nr:ABC transporter permease [Lachnospiraceae bacterium]
MFFHSFKYALKSMFRNKTALIWTIIFPMALGTIMFAAFGNLYNKDHTFHTLKVAVVREEEDEAFEKLLTELSKKDEEGEPLLEVKYTTKSDAEIGVGGGDYEAVIYEGKDIKLGVIKSDIQQEIVRSIVEQYNKSKDLIEEVAKKDPTKIQEVIDTLSDTEKEYAVEIKTTNGNSDMYTNYFYAIIAMSCMFSAYVALEFSEKISLAAGELGKRRSVAYQSKGVQAIAQFSAMWMCQIVIEIVSIFYLKGIGVNFGDKIALMIPVVIAGTAVGSALGTFLGAIPKMSRGGKTGLCTAISMTMCVMADLCAGGIKDVVEHNIPILNRINPAVLISDSFYALNVFDTYDRYIRNMTILGGMTVVLLVISFLILRREKGASI